MIEMTNVVAKYKAGGFALNGVSLKIEQGEFVYIIGATGSGKTTLMKLLYGDMRPQKGKIKVGKFVVNKTAPSQMPYYRRSIGVIFQDFKLLPRKKVYENLSVVAECTGLSFRLSRPRVKTVLNLVGLWDKRNAFPDELSGGQQQSVAIGRAIMNKPKVILADEPTGNLDPTSSDKILQLLHTINKEQSATVVMVTHNLTLIKKAPARVIIIEKGRIINDIPKNKVNEFAAKIS